MTRQLGKFQLLKPIAKGGMANIYIAKQRGVEGFEKLVVVKLLLPEIAENRNLVKLFLNEAKLAAQLNHPNVVQIFDLGFADGEYFIAMEYIHGENLSAIANTVRRRNSTVPLEYTVNIISQALEGLNYAHTRTDFFGRQRNIVHCDVSPQNILVSFEGVVKVVDFGIAKAATQYEVSRSGLIGGKLAYMSPEQSLGKPLDGRSDLFSLGIVFWELTAGRRMYGHLSPAEILQVLETERAPSPRHANPYFPVELEPIVLKSLEKNPDHRFQSAYEMHAVLEDFMKRSGTTSSTIKLGGFMRELFKDKLDSLQRIEEARAAGTGLEAFLFDDLRFDEPGEYDAQTPLTKDYAASASLQLELPAPRWVHTPMAVGRPAAPIRERRRTRRSLFLIALLVAAGALGYHFYPELASLVERKVVTPPAAGTKGTLRITSLPPGVEVAIDGISQGTTPLDIENLEVGVPHTVRAIAPGYRPLTTQLKLQQAHAVMPLHLTLNKTSTKRWGAVEVITEPPGAHLELDGKVVRGTTPITVERVSVKKPHRMRAWLEGRKTWVTTFKVEPDQYLILEGFLPAVAARGMALLAVDSSPPTVILLDDVKIGQTPLVDREISAGLHVLDLFSPQLQWTESLIIEANTGDSIREVVEFPKGQLDADSNPSADVYIHGERIGTTPLNKQLYAGSYQIILENSPGKLRAERKVVIKPGQTTVLMVVLDE